MGEYVTATFDGAATGLPPSTRISCSCTLTQWAHSTVGPTRSDTLIASCSLLLWAVELCGVTTLPGCAGGLSENDFIVAAKINALEMEDVLKPKRAKFWA